MQHRRNDNGFNYLHAEFDLAANCFRHFDGAIQLFEEEEYFHRRDSDFNMTMKNAAHIKARSNKVFKINGLLKTEEWVEFCCHFFTAIRLLSSTSVANIRSTSLRSSKESGVTHRSLPTVPGLAACGEGQRRDRWCRRGKSESFRSVNFLTYVQ